MCTVGGTGRGELLAFCVDVGHCVADRKDFFGGFVGNVNAELFFEGHDQLDQVE